MSPLSMRRALYYSLVLLLVPIHTTTAYSVEEICARRCLYHRGGVLCNCNARHFTGKRSDLAVSANMYTVNARRQEQQSPFSQTKFRDENSLVANSKETSGNRFDISQHRIEDLWGHHRLGDPLVGLDQRKRYSDDEKEDNQKNNIADDDSNEVPVIILEQEASDHDSDDMGEPVIGELYPVIQGSKNTVEDRASSEQQLRQLELAVLRALQSRR